MKTIFFISVLVLSFSTLQAQSLEEGKQLLYHERYRSAENVFHQHLKQNAGDAMAWQLLVKSYLLQDKVAKAADSLLLAPASIQSDPYFQIAYGAVLLQQNKVQEATASFSQALKETREKNAAVLAAIAEATVMAKAGDSQYAIELLQKAIKKDKHNPALYVALGDAYRKALNGTEAYKAYQKAIEENDRYAVAYHKIGEIFLTQKNPELYVEYFKKALAADPGFAPSLYTLYVYEFNRDPAKAMAYYKDCAAKSDPTVKSDYDMADLLYLNKQFQPAIEKARSLVASEGATVQPRLYKLIAYSYAGSGDTANAIAYMERYFDKAADSNFISKDYSSMAAFYASGNDSLSGLYYEKAAAIEKDSAVLYTFFKKLAALAAQQKDYAAQAKWLGLYYTGNEEASNVDLFNWGLAHYRAEAFLPADSIFGLYVEKYPEQSFGYYWQAKSKALQDKEMKEGLAVPAYQKLVEVLQKDTTNPNYKKWIVEAYGYLAAYEVNTEKDFAEAVSYFGKVLEIDPQNESAKKYKAMLEKDVAAGKESQ